MLSDLSSWIIKLQTTRITKVTIKTKTKINITAKRFETLLEDPIFKKYPDFKEMLDYFASEHCSGCRKEQCRIFRNCGVRPCHQSRGVNFCYECEEFPCDRTNFDESLYQVWVTLNNIIRDKGIEAYCEKARNRPRYG